MIILDIHDLEDLDQGNIYLDQEDPQLQLRVVLQIIPQMLNHLTEALDVNHLEI